MAYDLEQQESLASLKAWFDRYGNHLVTALLVLSLAAAGYRGWVWYGAREAAAAGTLFGQYEQALGAKDKARATELAGSLVSQYGATLYASLAALDQARVLAEGGDSAGAKLQLRWVMDKSGNPELSGLARVRLAGLLLDEKAYDEGLALLPAEPPAGLGAQVLDRRGDLLLAKGEVAQARAAYVRAAELAGAQGPMRGLLRAKADALPGQG
jgi:predicted negative regulator of RcsB-dependent stress response